MPNENEVKFALDDPRGNLELHLGNMPGVLGYDVLQAYLDDDSRIRRFTAIVGGDITYMFSFKRKICGNQIEIETEMLESDFVALLPTCPIVLEKRRFKMREGDVAWDFDFFKTSKARTYFVLAEAEMPKSMIRPDVIPGIVVSHLLLDVGRSSGFGNRRLADQDYAKKALKQLRAKADREGRIPLCDAGILDSVLLAA